MKRGLERRGGHAEHPGSPKPDIRPPAQPKERVAAEERLRRMEPHCRGCITWNEHAAGRKDGGGEVTWSEAWDDAHGARKMTLFPYSKEVEFILGKPNFRCRQIARRLRERGHDIEKKAEIEQAKVLYWMLGLFFEHGEGWTQKADEYLHSKKEPEREDGGGK